MRIRQGDLAAENWHRGVAELELFGRAPSGGLMEIGDLRDHLEKGFSSKRHNVRLKPRSSVERSIRWSLIATALTCSGKVPPAPKPVLTAPGAFDVGHGRGRGFGASLPNHQATWKVHFSYSLVSWQRGTETYAAAPLTHNQTPSGTQQNRLRRRRNLP